MKFPAMKTSGKNISQRTPGSYKRKKMIFWATLITGFSGILLLILMRSCHTESGKLSNEIRCAVCGAVKEPGVYDLPADADLSMLIRKANGLKPEANVHEIVFELSLSHDSVYHIPAGGMAAGSPEAGDTFGHFNDSSWQSIYNPQLDKAEASGIHTEPEEINILYIGLPAVYILINYFPKYRRVNLTHIPHSSVFLNNNYRLIDLFFTLGINPTKSIMQRQLEVKIDYYIIQEKSSFIKMINLMNGIQVNIDEPFAEHYDLEPGTGTLNGFYSWEYIRFLDFKRIKREFTGYRQQDMTRKDVFKVKPDDWANSYVLRHQRQRYVIAAMRASFLKLGSQDQLKTLKLIRETIQTNMNMSLISEIYRNMLSSSDFSYGRIPGNYRSEGNNLFFFPDEPSFKALRTREIRKMIKHKKKEQIVY